MSKRLYVGNINFRATETDLRDLFARAGEVVSIKLITDHDTGKLRGFGFVEMANDSDAEKAITMFNGTSFMDRKLVVNMARPREEGRKGLDARP
ncbi:MAG: RNA-binding protein [Thermodesulfovibrionales bacterium]